MNSKQDHLMMEFLALKSLMTFAALILSSVIPVETEVVNSRSSFCIRFHPTSRDLGERKRLGKVEIQTHLPDVQEQRNVYDTVNKSPVFSASKYRGHRAGRPESFWMIEPQCLVEPPLDMVDMTVEWSRPDAKHRPKGMEYVHLYRDNREVLDMKSSSYHGRTALFAGGLRHGNISLIITNVTTADEGTYKCFVPKLHGNTKSSIVHLIVDQNSNLKPPKTITSETRLHPEATRQSVLNVWPGGTFPVLCC